MGDPFDGLGDFEINPVDALVALLREWITDANQWREIVDEPYG